MPHHHKKHHKPWEKESFEEEAYHFYVSQGYDQTNFMQRWPAFINKFETAYTFYHDHGYNHDTTLAHLGGIDFEKDVVLDVIPKGQKQTQIQVAWGRKGNYFSTSDYGPEDIGIASVGRKFIQRHVAPSPEDLKEFPPLPTKPSNTPVPIFEKRVVTYEATEDIPCLKSTAKAIIDTWSTPDPIPIKGGGIQLFVGNKELMAHYEYGAHDKYTADFKARLQATKTSEPDPQPAPRILG